MGQACARASLAATQWARASVRVKGPRPLRRARERQRPRKYLLSLPPSLLFSSSPCRRRRRRLLLFPVPHGRLAPSAFSASSSSPSSPPSLPPDPDHVMRTMQRHGLVLLQEVAGEDEREREKEGAEGERERKE